MVKRKIEWSKEARSDLLNILEFYIERNGTATYSKKINTNIQQSIHHVQQNPFIGIRSDFESVRVVITKEFQIIYEIFDQLLLIIMIWDCRRNPRDKRIGKRIVTNQC